MALPDREPIPITVKPIYLSVHDVARVIRDFNADIIMQRLVLDEAERAPSEFLKRERRDEAQRKRLLVEGAHGIMRSLGLGYATEQLLTGQFPADESGGYSARRPIQFVDETGNSLANQF